MGFSERYCDSFQSLGYDTGVGHVEVRLFLPVVIGIIGGWSASGNPFLPNDIP